MKKISTFIILIVFSLILLIVWHNSHRVYSQTQTQVMMNTFISITALGPNKENVSSAIDAAFRRLKEIDIKFNHLNPESPLYDFNKKNIPIQDVEILRLIRVALDVSRESHGAFDITVAPLVELWGFYRNSPYLPSDQEIRESLQKIGYRHLKLNKGKLEKDNRDVTIDLGGIAKGYALAEAVKALKEKGISSAIIDIGGDVYVLGKNVNRLWRVGIKDPQEKGILGYVEVEDVSVVSSGNYERAFIKEGKRYHHIFNPRTGYPTEGIASVTLIYPDPILAQAWAKVPFVLGVKKGLEILEGIPGMEAIIVTDSKEILYTFGFKHKLKEERQP